MKLKNTKIQTSVTLVSWMEITVGITKEGVKQLQQVQKYFKMSGQLNGANGVISTKVGITKKGVKQPQQVQKEKYTKM